MKQESSKMYRMRLMNGLKWVILMIPVMFTSFVLSAQNYEYLFERVLEHKSISFGVKAHQELASNGITGRFFKDYIAGGFLEEDVKNRSIARLKDENFAGIHYGGSAFMMMGLRQSSFNLTFSIDYNSFNEILFHKDIFILYFKGNKSFEGMTANLTPFQIERTDYSAFKIGVLKNYGSLKLGLKMGICSGLEHLSLKTNKGTLFTATDGKYVDLQMLLQSYHWSSNATGIINSKALGLVLDGELSYNATKNIHLSFHFKNLGFMDWSGHIRERVVDTLYRYSGLEIDNLLDTFSIKVKNVDEIESDFVKTTSGLSRRSYLPAEWNASLGFKLLDDRFYISLGCGGVRSAFANTIYFINTQYRFSSALAGGVLIKKNAYAGWDLGMHMGFSLAKTLGIQFYWESLSFLGSSDRNLQLTGGAALRMSL